MSDTVSAPEGQKAQFSSTWDPSPDQVVAYDGVMAWWNDPNRKQILTLGGPGGSGKTQLAARIASEILADGETNVAFATLTGRASLVLGKSMEAAGLSVATSTIHALMYQPQVDEETGKVIAWKKKEELIYDLIIVDEASMIDFEMADDLASYGKPILAIGDHYQLGPVSGPSAYMENPDFRLEKIHRAAAENPLIKASMGVRKGASINRLCGFIEKTNDPRLRWETGDMGLIEAIEMAKPPGFLVCYTNAMRNRINNEVRRRLGIIKRGEKNVPPQVGETIMCMKNYTDFNTGIKFMNGERAEILSIRPYGSNSYDAVLKMRGTEIECRRMSAHQFGQAKPFAGYSEVPYITADGEEEMGHYKSWGSVGSLWDFGACATCHKSQGSQADNVAVIIEPSLGRMTDEERSRWLYTAISRSSLNVLLVTDV